MIALNLSRKLIKQLKRERTYDTQNPDGTVFESTRDRNAEPFEVLSAKERAMIIHEQLAKMPEHMRLAAILVIMEGLTQKDAAKALSCSEASVSRHLEMARKWLKVRLNEKLN